MISGDDGIVLSESVSTLTCGVCNARPAIYESRDAQDVRDGLYCAGCVLNEAMGGLPGRSGTIGFTDEVAEVLISMGIMQPKHEN